MSKYQWMRPCYASNAHAFVGYEVRLRRERDVGDRDDRLVPVEIWPLRRRCGSFTFTTLRDDERAELCSFCMWAVRWDWLIVRLRDCVLTVCSVRWLARAAVRRVERWLWGRP